MTGLANAHTHLYSGLAPLGMPAPDPAPVSFLQILERVWWRLDRALDGPSLAAAARLYVAEALVAGTTMVIDHHESPCFIEGSLDVVADACQSLGMRALVCYGATERNGGREEALGGLEECLRFIRSNTRPLVRGAVGLHASFTVSDATIRDAGNMCRALGAVLHVHLAEDAADVEDAQARGWAGPLERLQALGALVPGSILAHGVHLSAGQVRAAADLGCWIVQNPRSNRGNGVGYPRALGQSVRVALGTDGYRSDMCDELEALLDAGAAHGEDRGALGSRLVAAGSLTAERLGLEPPPVPDDAAADPVAFARATRDRTTRRLVVEGRAVVENGRLLTGDLDAIRAEAEAEAARLWHRMSEVEP